MQPNDCLTLLHETSACHGVPTAAEGLCLQNPVFTAPGGRSRGLCQLHPRPHPLPSSRPPEPSAHEPMHK
jgi:hypothetical protein